MKKTVLIVDDSHFMRNYLKNILNSDTFRVIGEAANGCEAVRQYMKVRPDVVLMDVTMPILTGIEALKKIIAFDAKANVVMCSSIGSRLAIIQAINIGARDFIVKPYLHNLNNILANTFK
ncbi:response regulator [Sporolactobacillus sp. CQH2019]|uniref:response regulator n=1 Tax=Sporolactobacillus sp. CQH2019 TaxID=3023512 RepID=UPI002367F4C0|nr:response regulator [Sporolactobacillus sp. CQH2019]MDD9147725.1 response regulator [Sporolactobacillus sp. CQH2019]